MRQASSLTASNKWVDVERGEISREIFINDSIYQAELEQVFARAWLFVGHESQIPNAGDFFVSRMGEELVVVVRGMDGQIRVFLNSCRHRGMKLCRYDEGNARSFTCPFHAWSYDLEGRLAGVPHFKTAYNEHLDRSKWGLIKVAKLANYKGSIWAAWDEHAPEFLDYLGGMRFCLDYLLDGWDGSDGGAEVAVGVQKWLVPCNWKFGAENFAGDAYHNISHRSVDLVGIGPTGESGRRDPAYNGMATLFASFPERGHAGVNRLMAEGSRLERDYPGEIGEWFRAADESRRRRLGELDRVNGVVGNIFPNMSYRAGQPRQIMVWHPAGARQTEVWSWYLFDKNAPASVKAFYRDYALRYCGPGGMTESDDLENWSAATRSSEGTVARRYPFNYALGLTGDTYNESIPGLPYRATTGMTERNARAFYSRWAQFMSAACQAELTPKV